eukprot:944430-Amphidinium_carterae.1
MADERICMHSTAKKFCPCFLSREGVGRWRHDRYRTIAQILLSFGCTDCLVLLLTSNRTSLATKCQAQFGHAFVT